LPPKVRTRYLIMTEFGIIFGVGFAALALAFFLGRPLLSRAARLRLATSSHSHVFAGVRAYLRYHDRALLAFAALIAVVCFVGLGVVRSHSPQDPAGSSYALAAWIVAASLLGALTSSLGSRVVAHTLAGTTPRILEAAKHGPEEAVREGIHRAGAASLAAFAIVLCGFAGLAVAAYAVSGGFSDAAASAPTVRLVLGFAFGTVLAAVVSHTIGGVFVAACLHLDHAAVGTQIGRAHV